MVDIGSMFSNPKFKQFASESLQDLGYGLSTGTNFGNALGNATQRMQQMQPMRDAFAIQQAAEAERQQNINETTQWLQTNYPQYANLPVDRGWDLAMKDEAAKKSASTSTANQNDFLFARSNGYEGSFEDWMSGGSGGTEYGLTPIWGQFADGSFGYGVQGKDGSFKQVDTGALSPLDPRTLNAERAFGAEVGGAQGAAVAAAPSDIATGQIALDLIQQIKSSPELPWATGTSAGLGGNAIPGTGRFGFQTLVDQAKSGAFLSAIQEMRGMGALSNAEGQTATQAITRMNTALSQADFVKALEDYERIVRTGIQRAQSRVGSGPVVGSGAAPAQTGGYTILGVE